MTQEKQQTKEQKGKVKSNLAGIKSREKGKEKKKFHVLLTKGTLKRQMMR